MEENKSLKNLVVPPPPWPRPHCGHKQPLTPAHSVSTQLLFLSLPPPAPLHLTARPPSRPSCPSPASGVVARAGKACTATLRHVHREGRGPTALLGQHRSPWRGVKAETPPAPSAAGNGAATRTAPRSAARGRQRHGSAGREEERDQTSVFLPGTHRAQLFPHSNVNLTEK